MKFWNKQKEVRLSCWTKITLSLPKTHPYLGGHFQGWTRRDRFDDAKRALQHNSSDGKFYMSIMNREIWFELREDAVIFALSTTYEKA